MLNFTRLSFGGVLPPNEMSIFRDILQQTTRSALSSLARGEPTLFLNVEVSFEFGNVEVSFGFGSDETSFEFGNVEESIGFGDVELSFGFGSFSLICR
jgi:hypothetical protein